MVVELDREAYGPDHHLAEWFRTPNVEETGGFMVCSNEELVTLMLGVLSHWLDHSSWRRHHQMHYSAPS